MKRIQESSGSKYTTQASGAAATGGFAPKPVAASYRPSQGLGGSQGKVSCQLRRPSIKADTTAVLCVQPPSSSRGRAPDTVCARCVEALSPHCLQASSHA